MDSFKLGFKMSLERVAPKAAKESWDRSDQHAPPFLAHLGKVCILILTTQDHWPQEIPLNLCKGSMLKSYVPDVGDLKFDDLYELIQSRRLKGKNSRESEVCVLRNFIRKGAIPHTPAI